MRDGRDLERPGVVPYFFFLVYAATFVPFFFVCLETAYFLVSFFVVLPRTAPAISGISGIGICS